jgi:hypothetical protein
MPVVRAEYHHCGRLAITTSQSAIPERGGCSGHQHRESEIGFVRLSASTYN